MYQKLNKNKDLLGNLHDNEVMLIELIRTKYRFGEITIITRDGLPMDILKTVERTRVALSTPSGNNPPLRTAE